MRILIINGPNLNMLGTREPEIYGSQTLADLDALCADEAEVLAVQVTCRQSNHEGEIVTRIQQAKGAFDGLLINAGAYTHTSVAIHDALKSVNLPVVEVHLSNPHAREPFRHTSYIAPLALAVITGCGAEGYRYGLRTLANKLRK
jgi:3-dehydroquinate dehydratase II